MFVTFEGCEGVGKSRQPALLKEYMKNSGQEAVYLREPDSTEISEKIRAIILDPANTEMTAETEALRSLPFEVALIIGSKSGSNNDRKHMTRKTRFS